MIYKTKTILTKKTILIKKTILTKKIILTNKQLRMPCSNCGISGHNRRTCKVTIRSRRRIKIMRHRHQTRNLWESVLARTQSQRIEKLKEELKEVTKSRNNLELQLKKINETKEICAVCQEGCLESESNKTHCGHVFHTGCLLPWLK